VRADAAVVRAPRIRIPIETLVERRALARRSRRAAAVPRAGRDLGAAPRRAMRVAQRIERVRIGCARA